jgi:H/ACA ribonucleoprotein complex subunit 4
MLPGVLRYDDKINSGDEIVLITTKGEAIAVAIAYIYYINILFKVKCLHQKLHHVIMVLLQNQKELLWIVKHIQESNINSIIKLRWGTGPRAIRKKALIKTGLLD